MAFDLIAELEQLVDALERAHVEYALCGGLALAVHGHPRATKDIDLLVQPDSVAKVRDVVRTLGFDVPARKMIFGLAQGEQRPMERISKLDDSTGNMLSLDLIHVCGTDLEEVWATRGRYRLPSRELVVVSPEGLVRMKKIAGRPQDLADVAKLEGTPDDSDT